MRDKSKTFNAGDARDFVNGCKVQHTETGPNNACNIRRYGYGSDDKSFEQLENILPYFTIDC